jgi:hypothetical protein
MTDLVITYVAVVPPEYPKWLRELTEAAVVWANDVNALCQERGYPPILLPVDQMHVELKPLAITDGKTT